MNNMLAVQVTRPHGPFELIEKPIPDPSRGEVRIRVQACGVCHSDVFTKEGTHPAVTYPRVPGHEVAGVVDAVGEGVSSWKVGERVGVGWHGGYCIDCHPCRRGDFINCRKMQVCGISYDGGYAEYMVAPKEALAKIPDPLLPAEASPLMCAGITTFNALRNSGARPGDLVAVLGIGGLGHLAVQFSRHMGFQTVAIARGQEKSDLAKKLGASIYLDSQKVDSARELQKLGGAAVILSTITHGKTVEAIQYGLGIRGRYVILGAADSPFAVSSSWLVRGNRSIAGWASGTSIDSEDTMLFSADKGIRSMNEVFPLEKAAEAYDKMMSGKARFRIVLTTKYS